MGLADRRADRTSLTVRQRLYEFRLPWPLRAKCFALCIPFVMGPYTSVKGIRQRSGDFRITIRRDYFPYFMHGEDITINEFQIYSQDITCTIPLTIQRLG